VGRQRQPAIAEDLLDQCADHALTHGLPDGLEPFAQATGTSPRMLLYHFGTRDELFRAVLRRAREIHLASFGELLRVVPGESYTATLAAAWVGMTEPEGRSFVRMFTQLPEQRENLLWPSFRARATTDWLPLLAQGLSTIDPPPSATLVLAVIRGSIMDLDATADYRRVDQAFAAFLRSIDPGAPEVSRPRHASFGPTPRAAVDHDLARSSRGDP